jgi:signal peptidase I
MAARSPHQRPRRQRSLLRDFVEVLLIAGVLYVAISLAFQTVRVDGVSMIPTLQNQDFLLASKIPYHLHDPERGDIIVLIPPTAADAGKDFIKRIIGLPGDVVKIDGAYTDQTSGADPVTAVLIKPGGQGPWQRLTETYLPDPWTQFNFCCQQPGPGVILYTTDNKAQELTIPPGQYFVLGDNRNESKDSRFIGLIPRENIVAKAAFRMFPLGTAGGLGNGPTLLPTAGTAAALFPYVLPLRRRRVHGTARRARPRRRAPLVTR